jgi:type VI protein secretion system component VasK
MNSQPENPSRFETAILVISFLLLWAWFLMRQSVYRAGGQPSLWLSLPLVFILGALAWVFVRRLRRVVRAMKEQKVGLGRPKR